MNATETAVLATFKALVTRRLAVQKVILFGSRARGDADPQSDADILVILDEPPSNEARDYISDCAWRAGLEDGIVVVPMVVSRDEWDSGLERYSLMGQAIRAEGIPI